MATDAPSAAIRRLMAAPIPRVPPMINATLPRNGSDNLLLPFDGSLGAGTPGLQACAARCGHSSVHDRDRRSGAGVRDADAGNELLGQGFHDAGSQTGLRARVIPEAFRPRCRRPSASIHLPLYER